MNILLDSSALIEYYSGTSLGEEVRKWIEKSELVFVPNVVIGEIVSKLIRLGFDPNPMVSLIGQYASPLEVPEYFVEAGKKHAEFRKKGVNASLIDAILLVLSEKNHAKFLTKDAALAGPSTILLKE